VPDPLRVAYTLEQLWHDVPGGTAIAAIRVAEELVADPRVELIAVAGRHRRAPEAAFAPPTRVRALPVARPWLYETWIRAGWPLVEAATGPVDVCHATTIIPAASRAPSVVTIHDLAFRRTPERFSRHGVRVMEAALERVRRTSRLVLCSSEATVADARDAGLDPARLRLVPLGVDPTPAPAGAAAEVRARYGLPEQFVLFVGTLEPRKNLSRLVEAVGRLDDPIPLVVAGAPGWGGTARDAAEGAVREQVDVRFLGFVEAEELAGLYAAATVFAYPSEWEGFGLPVLEGMAQGAPVVTSRGTSCEEVAGGAAVLVDPLDVESIAAGLAEAIAAGSALAERGRARATEATWRRTAELTIAAYEEAAR
jgi:glycosyltransferase involved in cell wall biosynthesis